MTKSQNRISEFKQAITKLYKKKKTTFVIALAFLLIIIFGVYTFLMQIANNQIVDAEKYRNAQKSNSIEKALYEISDIASYYSEEILLSNPSNNLDKYNEENNVRKSLKAFLVVYLSISFIHYSTDMQSIIVGNRQIEERDGFLYCNIKNNDLYLPGDDNWPNTIWIVDEENHTDNRVCIGINMNDFAKKFFPSYPDSGNIYCLADKNGKIIAGDVYDMVNQSIYDYVDKNIAISDYTYKDKFNGDKAYISFDGIVNNQLYLISVTYESQYTGLLTKYYINIICICAALIIGFILVFTSILYRLNKPIWKLIKDVQSFNGLNGDVGNDIAFLEQSIYNSLDKIMDLQEQLELRGDKLRNAQIVALQNQLNPHFLYNSLDAMNWRSMLLLGEENVVSEGIGYLSEIIAYGMDITHVTSTVKEELFITKQYIHLMKMRCGDDMRVCYSVDESLLDVRIAKFSMQPLLENSISHGFLSDMKSAEIDIAIYNDNGKLKIVIKDNGVGIEADKLAKLNEAINVADIHEKKHIGLKNINQRVKLIYGEQYGLVIESVFGEGTTCTISYPITRM